MSFEGEKADDLIEVVEAADELEEEEEFHFTAKVARCLELEKGNIPQAYRELTAKEQSVLDYAENFHQQFVELYPARRRLFLMPHNECDVPKFVCTTIRATQLPYPELYDLEPCAKFVGRSVEYEFLENPTEPPLHVVSPGQILKWQKGDSFDMSFLLTSLLIGAGYDAYCIYGYAKKGVTMFDLSQQDVPECEVDVAKEEVKKDELPTTYTLPPRKALNSNFVQKEEKAAERSLDLWTNEEQEERDTKAKKKEDEARHAQKLGKEVVLDDSDDEQEEEDGNEDDIGEIDELEGRRVHCWVLVLEGKRGQEKSVFIEPSTGDIFDIKDEKYLGIEALWNNKNYWVNMQDCSEGLGDMSFNLNDTSKFEFVLLSGDNQDENDNAEEEIGEEEKAREEIEKGDILDLPRSWCDQIALPLEDYQRVYPDQHRYYEYKNGTIDLYSDYSQENGIVKKLFKTEGEYTLSQEWFKHRGDRLRAREIFVYDQQTKPKTVKEYFEPGRPAGLLNHVHVEATSRMMLFNPEARTDGLVQRIDNFGDKVIETFRGRSDLMIERRVQFDKPAVRPSPFMLPTERGDYIATKMSVAYEPEAGKVQPISKITYFIGRDEIRVRYHNPPNCITSSVRVFNKSSGSSRIVEVDPFAKAPSAQKLFEQYQDLLLSEKDALQSFREMHRDIMEIEHARNTEEKNPQFLFSVFDVARNRQLRLEEKTDAEEEEEEGAERDYLSLFWPPNVIAGTLLSAELSRSVKSACLDALKERLIKRANLIQMRLDEENARLAKRQAAFQKSSDHIDKQEEEEYIREFNESMFRIRILEARLARHEEVALQKYAAMDQKLRADPRLARMHEGL